VTLKQTSEKHEVVGHEKAPGRGSPNGTAEAAAQSALAKKQFRPVRLGRGGGQGAGDDLGGGGAAVSTVDFVLSDEVLMEDLRSRQCHDLTPFKGIPGCRMKRRPLGASSPEGSSCQS
jgi:hypothetical protein